MRHVAGFQALAEHVAQRVHPLAVDDPVAAARHRDVILTHLAVGAVPFAGLPAFLAFGAPMSGLGVAAFAWATAPIVVALGLSQSGALDRALTGAAIAFTAMAALAAALTGGPASPMLALLLLPAIDAALAGSPRAAKRALAAAFAAFAGLAALGVAGRLPTIGLEPAFALACGGASATYALALAFRAAGVARALDRAGRPSDGRFELFAGSVGELVTRHAPNGAATFVSSGAQALLGAMPRELIGHGLFERIHIADRPAFLHALAVAAEDDATRTIELRMRGAAGAGAFVWVEMQARGVRAHEADAGSAAASPVVAMFRDVSSRKAHEEALVAAREDAERASLVKTRFLADMSHEIRTPLNAIIGFSEVLSDDTLCRPTPERRADYAALIRRSGEHLLEVVDSILDAARVESGGFSVAPRRCALGPLVAQCAALVALKAEAAGVALSVEAAADLPEIEADPRAMTQVALNLIANAIKFTPRGGAVAISVRPRGGGLALVVRDTGVGIAPEDIARLGEAFFRAECAVARHDGAGLGLSVVRGLVALHGGELSVESALGRGTTVTVFLPAAGAGAVPKIPARQIPRQDHEVRRRA